MADSQDTTLALLGIAATKKPVDLECPPENVMSAFIENRIDSKTRLMMLSHVNSCEDCYQTWETLSVFMAQHQQNKKASQQQNIIAKAGFLQRLGEWFNSGFSWQTALPGIALASLAIALVVNIPHSLYKSTITNPSVVAATTLDADTLAQSIQQLPVPWEHQALGFSKTSYSVPAKAVGAGIWSARNALMSSTDSLPDPLVITPEVDLQNSPYSKYFEFGQWTLDAWILTNVDHVKPAQWALLSQSLNIIKTGLKQHQKSEPEATIALQIIDKMKPSLDRLSQKQDPSAQKSLSREIRLGLQKLFL
ncbi:MAG TPA: hypothetical protein ENJ32_06650 [Crenotrichaceae bacterium]|nr:hypothetical protein [Crenotrichaceae bacterium]